MSALVSSHFAFGAHANIFPLGCGIPLYSITMTLHKSLILLLIFLLEFPLGLPYVKLQLNYHEFFLPY